KSLLWFAYFLILHVLIAVSNLEFEIIESSAFCVLHIYQARIVINLTIFEVLICPLVVTILNRIFFAKRMAGPVGRKQDAPEVRVTIELDSEHIVYLALHPVCAYPD